MVTKHYRCTRKKLTIEIMNERARMTCSSLFPGLIAEEIEKNKQRDHCCEFVDAIMTNDDDRDCRYILCSMVSIENKFVDGN